MVNKLFALVTYHCFRQHRKKVVRQGLIIAWKGEQLGKKMLKPEKEDRKKGKCILNNFINEVKKDLFRQLFIQNSCFYQ